MRFNPKQIMVSLVILGCFFFLGLFVYAAHAEEIIIKWEANSEPDIASYKVYEGTQVDMATWSWAEIDNVAAPTTSCTYDLNSAELRLYRVGACDTSGMEAVRYNAGVFSCFDWTPPTIPRNTGIE